MCQALESDQPVAGLYLALLLCMTSQTGSYRRPLRQPRSRSDALEPIERELSSVGNGEREELAGVPTRPAYRDPVWLVECAARSLGLAPLQQLVERVTSSLSSVLLSRECSSNGDSEGAAWAPAVEALEACRAELRESCAMQGAATDPGRYSRVIRIYASAQPTAWRTAFDAAFDQYRRAVSVALESALRAVAVSE